MKVTIPQNTKDITLGQVIRYNALKQREGLTDLEHNKRAISIFTNLPYQKIGGIKQTDYEDLINDITKAINTEQPFEPIFTLNEFEYGFIPNLDKMTQAEYMDLVEYQGKPENLNKVMAILFRPVKNKDVFGNYSINAYEGTAYRSEIFLDMPMNIVNGAMGFFLTLSRQLKDHILRSTTAELAKARKRRSTSKNGVGMQA